MIFDLPHSFQDFELPYQQLDNWSDQDNGMGNDLLMSWPPLDSTMYLDPVEPEPLINNSSSLSSTPYSYAQISPHPKTIFPPSLSTPSTNSTPEQGSMQGQLKSPPAFSQPTITRLTNHSIHTRLPNHISHLLTQEPQNQTRQNQSQFHIPQTQHHLQLHQHQLPDPKTRTKHPSSAPLPPKTRRRNGRTGSCAQGNAR